MKKLDKKNIETIIALTPMQEGMLFHYLKEPESKLHREHLSLDISGKIDKNAFEKAWKTVTRNNEMLRTLFRWENVNAPVQVTLKEHQPYVNHFESWTQDQEIKDTEKTFDLSDVPFRVSLYKKTEDSYRVVISNHHILYDGWSNGIILKEFFSAYHVLRKGDAELLLPPSEKTPFETFLQWTRDRDDKGDRQFWSSYLEGSRQGTGEGLKTPESEDREVKNFELRFEPSLKSKLDDFTRQHKVTLATVLYSAWGFLLQSYSDSSDILYDTTVSGRSSKMKGIENSVGLFINTLPLRVNASSGAMITDVLQTVNRQLREREAVEHTSQLLLKEYLEDYAGQLAFDSILVIENYPLDALLDEINSARQEEGALAVTSFSAMGMTPYDVSVIITALDEIVVSLTYDNRLFDEDAIRTLSNHFTFIVDRIIAEPGTPPTGIQLSPENITEIIEKIEAGRTAANKETAVYIPPSNDVERRLTAIWSEVLKAHESKPIGIDHNFFDFGGHSLKASLLAARIHKAFNVKVPLAEIFKHPTIREMAVYIDGKKEADGGYVPIEPAKEKQHYELSSSQKRFYHLQQMNPESTAYNVSILMEIDRNPDSRVRASLSEAFKQLIQRHESFRTSFHQVDGIPMQQIHPDVEFGLDDYEKIEDFIQPFDLSRAPLLRAGLVTVQVTGNESRSYLMLDLHHIITDGVSMDIFIHQLTTLYNGETLPPVGRHYKDFCQWQHDRLTGDKLKSQETYWLDRLSGELPVLNMLTDFPRPPVQSFEGDRIYFDLDILLTRRLNRLARETGTTLFILFLATLNVLLYRYTSQEDIVIGSTVAGRDHADVQDIIGLFIETLVLRNYPSGDQSFLDFLQHVKESTLAAFQNQEYPFRELLNQISDSGDLSRNPLFSVMLIVQNAGVEMKQVALGDLNLVPSTFDLKDSKVDFTLEAIEPVEGNRHQPVRCHIEYCTKLFKKETMERFSHHFVNVLQQVAEHPRVLLSGIEIMGEEETRRILEEFRGTGGDSEIPAAQKDQLTHHLFEEQVKKTPDGVAIVYEDRQYTYKELDEKANQLAEVIGQLD